MSINISEIALRYRETYRTLRIIVLISILGIIVESVFAYISSSIIIYTDVIHWVLDTALEVVSTITFYIVSKIYKRIKWNIFALEALLVMMVSFIIFGFYLIILIDTIRSYIETSLGPTTTEPLLAAITALGGLLTLFIYIIENRAYQRLRTEILRIDKTHALIDLVIAVVTSIGIVITAYTRSFVLELTVVLFVLFAALHTLVELSKEAIKSVLGFEANPYLKAQIISRLSELSRDDIKIGDVELRKMGTFYIVKVIVYLDPRITIGEAHKLRKAIDILCRETSDLIYHVDVVFYPRKRHKSYKRKERYRK